MRLLPPLVLALQILLCIYQYCSICFYSLLILLCRCAKNLAFLKPGLLYCISCDLPDFLTSWFLLMGIFMLTKSVVHTKFLSDLHLLFCILSVPCKPLPQCSTRVLQCNDIMSHATLLHPFCFLCLC